MSIIDVAADDVNEMTSSPSDGEGEGATEFFNDADTSNQLESIEEKVNATRSRDITDTTLLRVRKSNGREGNMAAYRDPDSINPMPTCDIVEPVSEQGVDT